MSTQFELVEAEALKLTPEERAELADRLWASVANQDEIEAAWDEEIARRIRQLESGEVETVSDEEVIKELRAKYG